MRAFARDLKIDPSTLSQFLRGKRRITAKTEKKLIRDINTIVIHCSDSDVDSHDNVETIRGWHKQRGFRDIGYHYVITKDGIIHEGRSVLVAGAHVSGRNKYSIGVCLTGRDQFTDLQFGALYMLLVALIRRFDSVEDILPHRDFNNDKTCPNFDVEEVISRYANKNSMDLEQ